MVEIIQFRKRPPRDLTEQFCCECGAPAVKTFALTNLDTGQSAGTKSFCDAHGPNTPLGATPDEE